MLKSTISIIAQIISYDVTARQQHYDTVIENIGVIVTSIFVLVLSSSMLKAALSRIILATDEQNTSEMITAHLGRMNINGVVKVTDIKVVLLENGIYYGRFHSCALPSN